MPAPFAFATATEILFGRGQAAQAAPRIAAMGRRVLLVQDDLPGAAEDDGYDLPGWGD